MSQNLWQRLFNRQPPKQAVLVLGSGRSGTSVMTRCLNLMGVSLGTANLLAPSKRINPKGYFENKDVIKIHKALGSKVRYRPAAEGYYDYPQIKSERDQLTTYLQNYFQTGTSLVIKDPRMNDYILLWQRVLADINVQPAEVILLRNPLDVVSSNTRAWHRDTTLAMRQWQVRTLLSLRDTQAQSRVLVTYEDLFQQTIPTLKRIATKFNLPWPDDEGLLEAQLTDFIDPNLQHSDSHETLADFEARVDVAPDVKALYRLGRRAAADAEFFASPAFQQQIDQLTDDYLTRYGALYRDFNAHINCKTFFVWGSQQAVIDQVNAALTTAGVTMTDSKAPIHAIAQALGDQLTNGALDVTTYPKDYRITAQKETLNNNLRKNAKRFSSWGSGDAENSAIVELLVTVNQELGTDFRSLVLVDDLTHLTGQAQRIAIQRLVRTLLAIQNTPYLLLMPNQMAEATEAAIADFVQLAEAPAAAPTDYPSDTLRLRQPIDWTETATLLMALCRDASVDTDAQGTLNDFIKLNAHEILTTKGDQYAYSIRN